MENIVEVFKNRRSVKYFDPDKKLDDETLKNIINMAVLAPSSMNIQPWEIYVVKSDKAKQDLYKNGCKQEKVLKASANLLIIGNTLGYKRDNPMWEYKKNNGMSEEKVEKIIKHCDKVTYPTKIRKNAFAVRNSSLLAMSIMYAAKYYEVDTHPMIGFKEKEVKKYFNIEDHKTISLIISIGYRDESKRLRPGKHRLKYDDIVKEF